MKMRVTLLATLCALAAAAPVTRARAQTPAPEPARRLTSVRVAKWALVGVAAGFGVYALTQSRNAETAYTDLRDRCENAPARCTLQSGHYLDAESERLFRRSIAYDRRSQLGIVGGQVALLGGAVLFIYDLRHARGPRDIPYPGAASAVGGTRLGVRLRF